jgi:hypothetical protein
MLEKKKRIGESVEGTVDGVVGFIVEFEGVPWILKCLLLVLMLSQIKRS